MDTVKVERTGSDSVTLSNDDRQYLVVSRGSDGVWKVRRYLSGVISGGTDMSTHETAEEAVESAKAYLQKGKDDLDEALRKSGL